MVESFPRIHQTSITKIANDREVINPCDEKNNAGLRKNPQKGDFSIEIVKSKQKYYRLILTG